MNTHQINAANNGFHWTIAFNENGDITQTEVCMKPTLYTLFECACGTEFDTKSEAISHLNEIDASESGEAARRFPTPSEQ